MSDLRVIPGGADEPLVDEIGLTILDLVQSNELLRQDVERLKRRERTRNVRSRRLAIVCALIASASTWGVAHATAATDAASAGGGNVRSNPCRAQHLADCRHAVRYWRRIARERRDAIAWQKRERRHERRYLRRLVYGNLSAWECIHEHEGAWNDSGAPYWGGLQMDAEFMATYGSDMLRKYGGRFADAWTPRDQIAVAQRAYRERGYHPWPNTARMCGLL